MVPSSTELVNVTLPFKKRSPKSFIAYVPRPRPEPPLVEKLRWKILNPADSEIACRLQTQKTTEEIGRAHV
jgi:hypothetical protein